LIKEFACTDTKFNESETADFVSRVRKGDKDAMKTTLQKVQELLEGPAYDEFCKYLIKL
jgi:hypothetical protein